MNPPSAKQSVVVLGASPNPERYSNAAVRLLQEKGYRVFPVHPAAAAIEGLPVYPSLPAIGQAVDTVTLYLSPKFSLPLAADLLELKPRRVVFNPGTEHPELEAALRRAGIVVEEACTLVLLRTGQF